MDNVARYPIDRLYARVDTLYMNTTAVTALGQREQEARHIARAEGFAIVGANEDWTFFSLDDGQVVQYDWDAEPHTIRTHFEWVQDKFEGVENDRALELIRRELGWGRFEGFVGSGSIWLRNESEPGGAR